MPNPTDQVKVPEEAVIAAVNAAWRQLGGSEDEGAGPRSTIVLRERVEGVLQAAYPAILKARDAEWQAKLEAERANSQAQVRLLRERSGPKAVEEALAKQAEDGVGLIAAERQRQINEEGWTPEHDDTHKRGELAQAAGTYAMPYNGCWKAEHWPFEDGSIKHDWRSDEGRIRELARAGALIAAEIDRRVRAALPSPESEPPREQLATVRGLLSQALPAICTARSTGQPGLDSALMTVMDAAEILGVLPEAEQAEGDDAR